MKLNRFSVYDLEKNEVVCRYYHERSNVNQLYHVLCWSNDKGRGLIQPYGDECPDYWHLRSPMLAKFEEQSANWA